MAVQVINFLKRSPIDPQHASVHVINFITRGLKGRHHKKDVEMTLFLYHTLTVTSSLN